MTATHTPVPIESVLVRTPIPTELAGTPLAEFAGVLPTQTPYWGVTPHPVYEAYSSSVEALKRGDYQTSIQYMEQVLRSDSTLADAYFIRGEAYRNLGLLEEAEAEYQFALDNNPTLAAAHLGLARIHLIREPSMLSEEFSKAISFDPKLLPAYLEQAEFLARNSQWDLLEELARNGLDKWGVKSPLLQLYEGQALYYLGRYEEALDSILLATSGDESILEAYYLQGLTLIALGRYEESISSLKTYNAYAVEDLRGWNAIGGSFYNLYDFEQAERAYSYVLVRDESNFIALFGRGLVYMDLDRYEDALADFDQAKDITPQSDKLEFARARAFFALNDPEPALDSLNTIFGRSLEPNILADAYALQALYYLNQSPPYISEAITNWEIILQLENVSDDRKQRAQNERTTLINFP
jgi:tetratricopeptide (TPR) repeat protein